MRASDVSADSVPRAVTSRFLLDFEGRATQEYPDKLDLGEFVQSESKIGSQIAFQCNFEEHTCGVVINALGH